MSAAIVPSTTTGAPEPALMTAQEVAQLLHLSPRTVWRLNSAGQLPRPVRLGAAVRWRAEEIKKWIKDGCPEPATPENDKPRR